MPHESSEDSSNQPNGSMGSPKCSPWPPGTPRPPPSTPNDSKTGLLSSLNSSDHLACFSNHQMTHQMSLLILWDISPLPLWSVYHQELRPWDLETLRPGSRVDLADLSSPVWSCYNCRWIWQFFMHLRMPDRSSSIQRKTSFATLNNAVRCGIWFV